LQVQTLYKNMKAKAKKHKTTKMEDAMNGVTTLEKDCVSDLLNTMLDDEAAKRNSMNQAAALTVEQKLSLSKSTAKMEVSHDIV